jgi:hypothetical protein
MKHLGGNVGQTRGNLVNDNLIEIDGIRIGIEICLDHHNGVLGNNLQNKQ